MVGGWILGAWGYAPLYYFCGLIVLFSLALIPFLKK